MERPFDFSKEVKNKAFFRQWNFCAICGKNLINLVDHAHHVIPNQLGRKGHREDEWIKEVDNCVILCEQCHLRAHQDGKFRNGAVAPPDYFIYSHGKNSKAAHQAWVTRIRIRYLSR